MHCYAFLYIVFFPLHRLLVPRVDPTLIPSYTIFHDQFCLLRGIFNPRCKITVPAAGEERGGEYIRPHSWARNCQFTGSRSGMYASRAASRHRDAAVGVFTPILTFTPYTTGLQGTLADNTSAVESLRHRSSLCISDPRVRTSSSDNKEDKKGGGRAILMSQTYEKASRRRDVKFCRKAKGLVRYFAYLIIERIRRRWYLTVEINRSIRGRLQRIVSRH